LRILRENEFAFESGTKFNFEEGVIAVNPTKNYDFDFMLYPNPADDFSNIEIESMIEADMQIQVHSIYGQLLDEKNIFIQEGTNRFSLNTSKHNTGIYLVSLKKGDQIRVLKLSIIK
jgi:hypothetical protein